MTRKPLLPILFLILAQTLFGCSKPSDSLKAQTEAAPASSRPIGVEEHPLRPITAACAAVTAELAQKMPPEKVVAVLPFTDSDGGIRRLGALAAEEIQRQLLDKGVKLADRQNLDVVLGEKDLQIASLSKADEAKHAGKLANADVLLLGTITGTGEHVLLSAKLLDVATGQPIAISQSHPIPANALGQLMWYVRRPTASNASGELPPLSLRYEFISPVGTGETALADGTTVVSGQQFKIRVQPNSDCCLYVLLYDSEGHASVLFPNGKIGLANDVRGGVSYEIPEGGKWYWFDNRPGKETFFVVASYTPLNDLDQLLAKMQQAGEQQVQLATAAQEQINRVATRGMSAGSSREYQPQGMTVRTRGVGGVVDIGWGSPTKPSDAEMENIVSGHATVVKKVVLNHR